MRRFLLAAALTALAATSSFAAAQPTAPLIERTKLFGNPSRSQGRISPDGKWLSWLAPRDGSIHSPKIGHYALRLYPSVPERFQNTGRTN